MSAIMSDENRDSAGPAGEDTGAASANVVYGPPLEGHIGDLGRAPVRMNRAMRRAKASQMRKKNKGGDRQVVLADPNAVYHGRRK